MKVYIFLSSLVLLFLSGAASSGVTSACESTLNVGGNVTTGRNALSEICYTRHKRSSVSDETFLKWSGHWDNNSDKYMQPVTSWGAAYDADLNTNAGETGWRLPTIKELKLLADYSNNFDNSDASKVFGDNWMIRQWLLRSSSNSSLIAHGNAYLLSSTYFGAGADQKVMALHINTGEIKAVNVSSDLKIYVLKVKESSPDSNVLITQHKDIDTDYQGQCITIRTEEHADDATYKYTDNLTVEPCPNKNLEQFKWYYEPNSGFIRYSDGRCVKQYGTGDRDRAILLDCANDITMRWNISSDADDEDKFRIRSLNSASSGAYFLYVMDYPTHDRSGDVVNWNYDTTTPGDDQVIWYKN